MGPISTLLDQGKSPRQVINIYLALCTPLDRSEATWNHRWPAQKACGAKGTPFAMAKHR